MSCRRGPDGGPCGREWCQDCHPERVPSFGSFMGQPPAPPPPPLFFGDPLPEGNEDMTLREARRILRAELEDGARCLCCGQKAQIHRWTLYGTAARLLVRLYAIGGTEEFVESKPIKGKGQGDGSRLRYWGLAEEEKQRRPDGGKSGWWRVMSYGEDFILGRATIPEYVYVYDNTVLPYTEAHPQGGRRTISDVLKENFHYGDHIHWAD